MRKLVPSLELCRKMKDKGWPQDGPHHIVDLAWYKSTKTGEYDLFWYRGESILEWEKVCSAPSLADIGEVLPCQINMGKTIHEAAWLYITKDGDKWTIVYLNMLNGLSFGRQVSDNEPDARAGMWLFLKEQGLL